LTGLARRPNQLLHQRSSQLGHARLAFALNIREALSKGPDLCTVLRKIAPLQDFNGLSHASNSFATFEDCVPCSCRDSAISARLQSGMTRLVRSVIHSVIIGLVPIVDLVVGHSVVYCCLTKPCWRPQHDPLHLSTSRTTLVESHLLGRPFAYLSYMFFSIVFPLCLSFWTPMGIDLNLVTGAMRSLKSRSPMAKLSRDIASISRPGIADTTG
jgi:hypothetical protein